jgi:hypothetical protein
MLDNEYMGINCYFSLRILFQMIEVEHLLMDEYLVQVIEDQNNHYLPYHLEMRLQNRHKAKQTKRRHYICILTIK